jgi:hypothetical protein
VAYRRDCEPVTVTRKCGFYVSICLVVNAILFCDVEYSHQRGQLIGYTVVLAEKQVLLTPPSKEIIMAKKMKKAKGGKKAKAPAAK